MNKLKAFVNKNMIVLFLVLLCVGFGVTNRTFFTPRNLMNLTSQMAINALLSSGLTYVIILGGIDISVGSVAALAGVISCMIGLKFPEMNLPGAMAIIIFTAAGVGGLCGLFNGIMITRFNVVPMICTLATMTMLRGLTYIVTGGVAVFGLPSVFSFLGAGRLIKTAGEPTGIIPVVTLFTILVVALMHGLLSKTVFGRHVYACGSNAQVAHLSGINVKRVNLISYVLCGVMAALGGVLVASRLQNGQPAACEGYEMFAIASTVLGGTSLTGGSGSVGRAMFGVAIIAVINNGMNLLYISSFWQKVVIGSIILLAVILDMAQKQKKMKGREKGMKDPRYLALDIGGTKTSAALFTGEGEIVGDLVLTAQTQTFKGEERVYENVRALLQDLLARHGVGLKHIAGLGVGSPGPLDTKRGLIIHAPLMGWKNFPVVERLAADFGGLPVRLDNDGNLGALAEQRCGVAQGCKNIIYLTVSTGCGGGILINGEVYHGAHDGAGELGHMTIDPNGLPCPCGSRGCFELYASGTALLRRMAEDLGRGVKSRVFELAAGDAARLSGRLLDEAAAAGDSYALALYRDEGFYLGVGLANLFNLFDPELVVLGGGITKGRQFFHPVLMETLRSRCEQPVGEDSVRYSRMNDRVVLHGAFFLIREAAAGACRNVPPVVG